MANTTLGEAAPSTPFDLAQGKSLSTSAQCPMSNAPFPTPIMKDKLLNWLNMVLVADVFLVLFGFGWLAIAAIGDAAGVNLGLDLWHQLWQPLFNPAIGILMGGAILSGIISWVSKKFLSSQ